MSPGEVEFDPAHAPLDGQSLIEASAGTGKTYNIVRLFARLLLEPDSQGRVRRIGEILTVTFTRAATEELRERIRRLLEELLLRAGEVTGEPSGGSRGAAGPARDPFADAVFDRIGKVAARARLLRALADFDEAPVFTIHGFCRRALAEFAFEARESLQADVVPGLPSVLRETTLDFWRRAAYPGLPSAVAHLLTHHFTPETLSPLLRTALGRPEAQLPTVPGRSDLPGLGAYEEHRTRVIAAWNEHRDAVLALFAEYSANGSLYRGAYEGDALVALRSALDVFVTVGSPAPGEFDATLYKLLPDVIAGKTKKGYSSPSHVFFDAWRDFTLVAEQLSEELTEFRNHLTSEFVKFGRAEVPRRGDKLGVLTYDDLPARLDAALLDPALAPRLCAGLRRRYTCALVDEFQDTDPVQWRIFQTLFNDGAMPLFLIGDPKQAIYGFRGADLDVYLAAAEMSEHRHTLRVNFRSSRRLLSAFNVLFSRPNPFLREGIAYHAVRSPADSVVPELSLDGRTQVPLEVCFPAGPDGLPRLVSRTEAKDLVRRGTVDRIVLLLTAAQEGRALLGARPVRPGDIAVLVRTNREAEEMRAALERAGVQSVLRVDKSLFDSSEAEQLHKILRAIENPSRGDFLREALVTELLGWDAHDLLDVEQSESAFSDLTLRFRDYRELWMRRGFMHMFQELLGREKIPERLLSYPEGERRMTNVTHLAEVLHREGRHRRGAELRVLRGEDSGSVPEEHLIRLESDEEAVQVVTSHLSKGLQYGIVFVPFAWSLRPMAGDGLLCGRLPGHDGSVMLPSFLGGPAADSMRSQLKGSAARQTMEEELRLLYVAVTRARSHCTLVWGSIRGSLDTAPAHVFHNRESAVPAFTGSSGKDSGIASAQLLQDLTELVNQGAGAIAAGPLELGSGLRLSAGPRAKENRVLSARHFGGTLAPPFRVRSFTSLLMENRAEAELPAHAETPIRAGPPEAPRSADAFGFPRGARTGVFFHLVFERYFAGERADLPGLVSRTAASFGLSDWAGVALSMVRRTLRLHIPGVVSQPDPVVLGDLPIEDCLTEVQFYYPEEAGFMTGFADLVFRAHGRYFLLDWKTNFLGGKIGDYDREHLEGAMRADAYDVQYSIYVHALDRYLRLRDPLYRYEPGFGGVVYVFVRGLQDDPAGESGVFFARPTEHDVRAFRVGGTVPGKESP